jgi:hypothetical protein
MEQHDAEDGAIRSGEPPLFSEPGFGAAGSPVPRRRVRIALLIGLLAFAFVLTAAKHFFNELDGAFYDAYYGPKARTAVDANSNKDLVSRFKFEPAKLVREDKTYEFNEAWLEAAYEPVHHFVWFSYRRRADWNYLCIRPTTSWHQGDFTFRVAPKFAERFEIAGRGSKGGSFTQSGNDLYYQKVPTDLKELDLIVSVETYGKGKDLVVGTSHLTRVD